MAKTNASVDQLNTNLVTTSVSDAIQFNTETTAYGGYSIYKSGNTIELDFSFNPTQFISYGISNCANLLKYKPKHDIVLNTYACDGDMQTVPIILTIGSDGVIKYYCTASAIGKTVRCHVKYLV